MLLTPPPETTEQALVDRIHQLATDHGEDWCGVYLRERGAERWADRLGELRQPNSNLEENR